MLWNEVDVCGFAGVWGSAPHGAKTMGGVSLNNSKAHANCVYKIVSDRQQSLVLEDVRWPAVRSIDRGEKAANSYRISNETKQPTKGSRHE